MKAYKFKKLDAFAVGGSPGNPAGAVYPVSSSDIDVSRMQKIAKELKGFVSEVGYVLRRDASEFDLVHYSSEREVDFCGHATVAIMYDLIKNNEDLLSKDTIYITTKKGRLPVSNRIRKEDAVFITAPEPVFSDRKIGIPEISKALRINESSINSGRPVSIINAGLETLLVPIGKLSEILAIAPDIEELKAFCINNSIDIITVFSEETSGKDNALRSRVFAPTFGYLEDPATGSGNSALGYYLESNGMWKEGIISIEQNGSGNNYNIVKLELGKGGRGEPRVAFGGSAAVRISGEYYTE